MARFDIIQNNAPIANGAPTFTGAYMKPGVLTFREIASPSPINWRIGSYVDYPRTGLRYYLYNIPQVKKQAGFKTHGAAYVYQNVQLHDATYELEICPFRDLVYDDNRVHFSTQSAISVFDDVAGIAERVQACLDNFHPGAWVVRLATEEMGASTELLALMQEEREFVVSGVTLQGVMDKVYEIWPEVGYVYSFENGKHVLTIGGAGLNGFGETYRYGKGHGLVALTKTAASPEEIANRLYVYGSARNMLPNWYNKQEIHGAESVDIQNLMIPIGPVDGSAVKYVYNGKIYTYEGKIYTYPGAVSHYAGWGITDGLPDPAKAYIEDAASIAARGLRAKSIYFDGSGDLKEIYPTIERVTIAEVRDASPSYVPASSWPDAQRVDEVYAVTPVADDGLSGADGKAFLQRETEDFANSFQETVSAASVAAFRLFTKRITATVAGALKINQSVKINGWLSGNITGVDVYFELAKVQTGGMSYVIKSVKQTCEYNADEGAYHVVGADLDAGKIEVEAGDSFEVRVTLSVSNVNGAQTESFSYSGDGYLDFQIGNYRASTFTIQIPQIGFDIAEQAALGEGMTLAFRSGKCAGREFKIKSVEYRQATDTWLLEVIRSEDESLAQWFPNTDYQIEVGDHFVLLDIAMPGMYINIAEKRLLASAQEVLADVAKEQWQYTPDIDAKFMVESGRVLLPAQNITLEDDIVPGGTTRILIDSVTINEGEAAIPTYKVTLRDKKKKSYSDKASVTPISSRPVEEVQTTATSSESSSGGGSGSGHTHDNKADLDKLGTDGLYITINGSKAQAGYADRAGSAPAATEAEHALEADHADTADEAEHAEMADEAEHAKNADLATRATTADYALDSDKWDGAQFGDYLNQPVRTTDDVAFNKVTTPEVSSRKVASPDFTEGPLGAGFRLWKNAQGNAELELDSITVRKTLKVFELIIQQLKYQGGMVIYSAASAVCTEVEELSNGYKCYIDTKEDENGRIQEPNLFVVGDQVRCQRFQLGTTVAKYYWRLVTAVGDDYIVLSKTDCDTGSDAPEAGDNMIQLGHRTNTSRQSAKVTTTIDGNSPRDDYYKGINSYDLTGKLITTVGVRDGEVGVYTKNGEFTGRVVITGGSGLQELDEWADLSQSIADAAQAAADAQADADRANAALAEWASDGYISPVEKEPLSNQWTDVRNEYSQIIADATRYGVDFSAFTAAYTIANAAFQKYTANPTESTAKEADYDNIAAYYAARATILGNIAAASKGLITTAQNTANSAVSAAAAAQLAADTAQAKADALEVALALLNDDTVLDQSEKNIIRTEWITINGIEDLGRTGAKGSYITTKNLFEQYRSVGGQVKYSMNGRIYTFGNLIYTYSEIGVSALDAAYLALREFLRSVGLNDRDSVFEGFDRAQFASLLTDYYDAELRVNDNINKAIQRQIEDAKAELLADITGFESAIEQTIQDMKDVLDNTIETWFGTGVPDLTNYPASQWQPSEYESHIGDLYYDDNTGVGYRFQLNEATSTYYWNILQDTTATAALALARQAKDTADGKRRVFLAQPTDAQAYDEGDLWLHATIGAYTDETLVCRSAKAAGVAFNAGDWTTATKYTDDTVANAAQAAANAAQQTADNAATAASRAQTTADNAATVANAATTRLDNWANDGYVSPTEKLALKQQKEEVDSDYTEIIADAGRYAVSTTAFVAAYNAAVTAFNKYTASTPELIEITADFGNIAAYYDARATILDTIAVAAKKVATDAQAAADAAQQTANAAGSAAALAQTAADNAATAAATAQSTANAAKSIAEAARDKLATWGSDGYISPTEKTALIQQFKDVQTERDQIVAQATSYSVSTTAYLAAYAAAVSAFNKYTAATPESIAVESDYANIAAYYDARTLILDAISTAAKKAADDAQATANDAAALAQDAMDAAEAVAEALEKINLDAVLDQSEKEAIRTTWTGINGIVSTGAMGTTGTYYAAKQMIEGVSRTGLPVKYTFNGKVYTFRGAYDEETETYGRVVYTMNNIGEGALDAAYLALREYLNSVQLNIDGEFTGFDRDTYAKLLRDYNVALNNVMKVLSDIAKKAADDAQNTANEALTDARAAVGQLTLWGADGAISPMEKRGLVQIKADITKERDTLVAKAVIYGADYTEFQQAYTRAITALNKYTADLTTTQARDEDYEYIAAYYGYRDALARNVDEREKAVIDAKAAKSDVEYLTRALAKDDTVIQGGVVLSSFIGVKRNSSVKAAINASGSVAGFSGSTHGVLMIAAGITTLAQAKDNATFRVFEDGFIVATAGLIGGFNIGASAIYNGMTSYADQSHNGVYIGTDGIALGGGKITMHNTGAFRAIDAIIQGKIIATELDLTNATISGLDYSDVNNTPDLTVYVAKDGTIGNTPAEGVTGFFLSSTGLLRASNALIYGTLYSTAGMIGGWTLSTNRLYSGSSNNYVGISSNTSDTYAFWAGASTGASAPFSVTRTGAIKATSGAIGGFDISDDHLGITGTQPTPGGTPSSTTNGAALYPTYLQFKRSNSNVKGRLTIGASIYQDSYVGGEALEIWLDGLGKTASVPIYGRGISVDVTRFQKNIAIDCLNGMIAGLRPLIYYSTGGFIYTDRLASDYPARAHTIIVNNTSGQNGTLYVSSNPQDGEEYLLIHTSTNAFYISPRNNAHPIFVQHDGTWHVGMSVTSIQTTSREMCYLIYSASMTTTINGTTYTGCWICQFFHN